MRLFSRNSIRMLAIVTGSMAAGGLMTGTAMALQGHMFGALHGLQIADNQLHLAAPDKSGHRENAINLVGQAISEVNAGIAAGAE